jgi:hypothetical protein
MPFGLFSLLTSGRLTEMIWYSSFVSDVNLKSRHGLLLNSTIDSEGQDDLLSFVKRLHLQLEVVKKVFVLEKIRLDIIKSPRDAL